TLSGQPVHRLDFRYAPLLCPDLSGLPPALVIAAEYDPLCDEDIEYAERLRAGDNAGDLVNYQGMVHAFYSMSAAIDAGKEAIERSASALKRAFAQRKMGAS